MDHGCGNMRLGRQLSDRLQIDYESLSQVLMSSLFQMERKLKYVNFDGSNQDFYVLPIKMWSSFRAERLDVVGSEVNGMIPTKDSLAKSDLVVPNVCFLLLMSVVVICSFIILPSNSFGLR